MRRIIGAVILFTAAVLPRWGDLIHTKNPGGSQAPAPAVHSTGSIQATSRDDSKRATIPEAYRRNPLQFLSRAPVDSLVLLPGIGPVIAERIASARTGKRTFTRWEELLNVRGIGPKKLDRLKRAAEPTE